MTATAESLVQSASFPGAYKLIQVLGEAVTLGNLTVTLPNGFRRTFGGKAPGPRAGVCVNNTAAVRQILFGGARGFAEAYMSGDVDSPDITEVVRLALANWRSWGRTMRGRKLYRMIGRMNHALRPNTRAKARCNIARHYDLGNSFYGAWLDPTMTYSSGLFDQATQSLDQAQANKYAALARMADLRPGVSVLEIGCGWGGFAAFAAREVGCTVTALTISEAQHAYASERIAKAGLSDKVEIRLQDYREIEGQFDAAVSIEMFEAVGQRYWPVYFGTLFELLRPGGHAAIQTITIKESLWDEYRGAADFIQLYIFPGGMLPTPGIFRVEAEKAGLRCGDERRFGADYARTLGEWHARFDAAWDDIVQDGFDERFRRMWKYYLAYCQGGFEAGRIDVMQFALVRP